MNAGFPQAVRMAGGRKTLERLLALVLGLLVSLAALEIALRAVGEAFWRPEGRPGHDVAQLADAERWACEDCRRIICLGDSITYGIGASEGNDYPSQLERLLRATSDGDQRHIVVNAAIGGGNSTAIKTMLPDYLANVRPHAVVVMAGHTNRTNFQGFASHVRSGSLGAKLQDALFEIRGYRLLRYITDGMTSLRQQRNMELASQFRRSTPVGYYLHYRSTAAARQRLGESLSPAFTRGAELLKLGQNRPAAEVFQAALAQRPHESSLYWGMGQAMRGLRAPEEARRWYERGIQAAPGDPALFHGRGEIDIDQDRVDGRTLAWFQRGLEADPSFTLNHVGVSMALQRSDPAGSIAALERCLAADPDFILCYPRLMMHHQRHGTLDQLQDLLAPLADGSPVAASYFEMARVANVESSIDDWIAADMAEIVDLCQKQGVQVLIQEYPLELPANRILRQLAQERDLPLIENTAVFREGTDNWRGKRILFYQDMSHPNDQGYSLMAQHVLEELRQHGIVSGQTGP